jgi:hypothetical protein
MFRRIQNAFAVVAFVCVILGFGYQVWRTSNNPPPSQHQTNYAKGRRNADDTGADNAKPRLSFLSGGIYKVYSYCADKPDSESDQWLHDKFLCDIKATDLVVAICTTLLMLLTAALAFFTFKLWSGAERTAKRQLRAYVMVDKAMALDYGPRPRVQVIFRNLGQTPVHNLTIWATQDVCAYPLYDKPDAPDVLPDSRGPLAPGTSVHLLDFLPRILVQEELTAIADKKAAIFCFGRATYDDAFGKGHTTEFCFTYGGPRSRP